MTRKQQRIMVLIIAACMMLAALMIAAWPATASLDPAVTPTTYGPPGPHGGPL